MSIENPKINKNIDILPEEQNLQTDDHQDEVFFEENNEIDIESASERIKKCELLLGSDKVEEIRNIVQQLHEPMAKMLEQVLDNIKMGEYQLIIGEDASGRIPTLIVRRFVNKIYKNLGLPDITTRHFAGRNREYNNDDETPDKIKKMKEYIQHIKDASNIDINKALVVTDYIAYGTSIAFLIKMLGEANIKTTLLTVGSTADADNPNLALCKEKYGLISVHSGGEELPLIYGKSDISGVEKNSVCLHAEPIRSFENIVLSESERMQRNSKNTGDINWGDRKRNNPPKSIEEIKLLQASIAIGRDEANKVADSLIEELLDSEK